MRHSEYSIFFSFIETSEIKFFFESSTRGFSGEKTLRVGVSDGDVLTLLVGIDTIEKKDTIWMIITVGGMKEQNSFNCCQA